MGDETRPVGEWGCGGGHGSKMEVKRRMMRDCDSENNQYVYTWESVRKSFQKINLLHHEKIASSTIFIAIQKKAID